MGLSVVRPDEWAGGRAERGPTTGASSTSASGGPCWVSVLWSEDASGRRAHGDLRAYFCEHRGTHQRPGRQCGPSACLRMGPSRSNAESQTLLRTFLVLAHAVHLSDKEASAYVAILGRFDDEAKCLFKQ